MNCWVSKYTHLRLLLFVAKISKSLSPCSVSGAVPEIIVVSKRNQSLCPVDLTFWCGGEDRWRRQAVASVRW